VIFAITARSMLILPDDMTGEPVVVRRSVDTGVTPTLVTVPPPFPPPPPVDEIVTSPFALLTTMFVPAMMFVTPELVIDTMPVDELALTFIPLPAVNVLYGLAHAKSVSKLVCDFVKAVYNESLPTDSLGKPMLIVCLPDILIFSPYDVFINKAGIISQQVLYFGRLFKCRVGNCRRNHNWIWH